MTKESTKPKYESNPFKVVFGGTNELFKYNQTWAIIIIVVGFLLSFPGSFNSGFSSGSSSNDYNGVSPGIVAFIIGLSVFLLLLSAFLNVLYRGAVAYVVVKTIEGKKVGFSEALKASLHKFWRVLWTQIIVGLKVLGGFILLVVPGVRAALRYNMVLLPIFAENKTTKQAIGEMKELTKNNLIEVFGMVVAAGIIPVVGPMLGVGAQVLMYPQLRELKSSGAAKPPTHWLNYLGFILFIVFLLFILSIVGLILIVVGASQH